MNNKLRTKIIAGTAAASLILGAAGYLESQQAWAASDSAIAAAPSTAASAAAPSASFKGRGHRGGMMEGRSGSLTSSTAELLGVTPDAIQAQLQEGLTLAQIAEAAGLGKEDYLAKLLAAETAKLDEKLAAGDMTEEQAAAKKAGLAEMLTQAIETNQPSKGKQGRGGHGFGRFGNSEELAAIVGVTADELKSALDAGQSLAEIAAAQGMSEADLIAKLQESMSDELKTFVQEKRTAKPAADAAAGAGAAETA